MRSLWPTIPSSKWRLQSRALSENKLPPSRAPHGARENVFRVNKFRLFPSYVQVLSWLASFNGERKERRRRNTNSIRHV